MHSALFPVKVWHHDVMFHEGRKKRDDDGEEAKVLERGG
jgi:hypothetical protein